MHRLKITFVLVAFLSAYSAAAEFYIAPHIQNITQDGATLIWETSDTSQGVVQYGAPGALDMTATEETASSIHRVRMTGLSPETEYAYRVTSGDVVHDSTFLTAPAGAREVVFVVIGDPRRWGDTWESTGMKEHVMQWNPEFFVTMGDLVVNGHDYKLWTEHFGRFADISDSLWLVTARGNHEGSQKRDIENDWFAKYHELPGAGEPYASFDWGNCHFALISYENTGTKSSWDASAEWLDTHLDSVNKKWVITAQHFPVYCTGYDSVDQSRKEPGVLAANYAKVLETHDVDLNVAGHTHIFERIFSIRDGKRDDVNGVHYLINGGDIGANYPDWFTVTRDDEETMDKPTYTVFHAKDDRLEYRTFVWSKPDNAIQEIDYCVIWDDESLPKSVVASLQALSGDALVDAIRELGAMGYAPAAPELLPYLQSDNRALRRAAAAALSLIGGEAVAEPLHEYVNDSDPEVARDITRSIEIGMPESVARQVAKDVLDDTLDARAREHLAGALQLHAEPRLTTKTMLDVLENVDGPQNLRRRAAYALGVAADKGDVRKLVKAFEREPDDYVTLTLAWKLGDLTGKRVDVDDDGLVARSQPGRRREFAEKWK